MNASWISLILFVANIAHADCRSFIAESEIQNAIALQPNAGAKACGAGDPCVCFDGVDWETATYSNGQFGVDASKQATKAAKENAQKAKDQSKVDARARLKAVDWSKVNTAAELKAVLKDLIDKD